MWQPTIGACSRSASPTARYSAEELRPRRRRLERLDHHAAVQQVVAQVGPVEARALPRAPGGLPEGDPAGVAQRLDGGLAPRAHRLLRSPSQPTIASAPWPRRAPAGSADSAPARRPRSPVRPSASRVSSSSDSRATSGATPPCSSAPQRLGAGGEATGTSSPRSGWLGGRAHAQRHLGDRRRARPRSRRAARRRSGPAALAGCARRSRSPAGAASRTPTTSSSMRP